MEGEELTNLYGETVAAADALLAKAKEAQEFAERIERLAQDTPAWHAGTRAKVEARAALEQAEELRRVLGELGDRLG
jgi:hypothetical protein